MKSLNLSSTIIKTLSKLNINTPTPIQQRAIPAILEGFDIIAQAKTGSGKTLAFLLPILQTISSANRVPKALIIAPTRELCEQIANEAKRVATNIENLKIVTLYGGVSLTKQVQSLENGADIVVGTPGRLNDILFRQSLDLSQIKTLVLDEADRMLDMGFGDDVKKIMNLVPKNRQTLLFSATYQDSIKRLSKEILSNPKSIKIETKDAPLKIDESLFVVQNKEKSLIKIVQCYQPKKVLIFCNTKVKCAEISDYLYSNYFDTAVLNGDLEQYQRDEMLLQFANNTLPILVATDLASRGLDIKDIDMIINYDAPFKEETYIHRIGRTARADASGKAITLCKLSELDKFTNINPNLEPKELKCKQKTDFTLQGAFSTIKLDGGKRKKIRAGDILGVLCKELQIDSKYIGKIDVFSDYSYVAIDKSLSSKAYKGLQKSKIKKRKVRVWML